MAGSSAVGKLASKLLQTKYVLAHETNIRQAFNIGECGISSSGPCTRFGCVHAGWPSTVSTKRKLPWCWLKTVGAVQLDRRVEFSHCGKTARANGSGFQLYSQQQKLSSFCGRIFVKDFRFDFCSTANRSEFAFEASDNGLHSGLKNNKLFAGAWFKRRTYFSSPAPILQYQNVRHFSRRRRYRRGEKCGNGIRHDDDGGVDDDDEEKKRKLRGAVMYISNPMSWLSKLWNLTKLKQKFDPAFSENEFLFGAKQAVSHVSQMVSAGKFDHLTGLVVEEVIEWLMSFRNSLAATEREALALSADDVVLIKIRSVHLDSDQDKEMAFVDSVCFGLRMCDRVPYLVDLGIRFKQDYSTDPPSGWVVAGVSHIRVQNLATDSY